MCGIHCSTNESFSLVEVEALAIMMAMEGANLGEDDIGVGGFTIAVVREEKHVYKTTA